MPYVVSDRSLGGYRGAVTRVFNALSTALNVDSPGVITIKTKSELLSNRWDNYIRAWDEYIAEREGDLTQEKYDALDDKHARFETDYMDLTTRVDEFLSRNQLGSIASSSNGINTLRPKLPEVKLIKFSGVIEEYQIWWANFRSLVHDRKDLDKVTKMTHLKGCVTGRAEQIVAGYQIDDQSYDDAVAELSERFANPDRVKNTLVLKIVDLPKPKNNPKELENFKNEYSRLLKLLAHYVANLSESNWFIAIILQSKLPPEAELFIFSKFQIKYFDIDQISRGLIDHIEFLERSYAFNNNNSNSTPKAQISGNESRSTAVKGNSKPQASTSSAAPNKTEIGTYAVGSNPPNSSNFSNFKRSCLLCSASNHKMSFCTAFPDESSRRDRLNELKRCLICFRGTHDGKCKSEIKCFTCGQLNHNNLFCKTTSKPQTKHNHDKSTKVNTVVTSQVSSHSDTSSALATARVTISDNKYSKSVQARCFFDPGSQISFITAKMAKSLNLKVIKSRELTLHSFHSSPKTSNYEIVSPLVTLGKRVKRVTLVVIDQLPNSISSPGLVNVHEMLKSQGIQVADDVTSDTVTDIELMLGSDFFAEFVGGVRKIKDVSMFHTPGGVIPFGRIPACYSTNSQSAIKNCSNVLVCRLTVNQSPLHVSDRIDENVEPVHKLWELESIGINPTAPSIEDNHAYQNYVKSVRYLDGKYHVRLPWKPDCQPLPNNYRMALGQLYSLHSNLSKFPGRVDAYHAVLQEQLSQEFIELVPDAQVIANSHYIPHHAVLKKSETTPLRIVYNCSARAGKDLPSLNDCLIKGPCMSEKLGDILLKFRTNKYAYAADISKAFLRVRLQQEDRDFVRFLWFKDPYHPELGVNTYRFSSVLFGSTSSPFLLMATLDYHMLNSDSPFKDLITDSFYVDNLQGTMQDEDTLLQFYVEANHQMSKADMPLRSWVTNNDALNNLISSEYHNYVIPDNVSILGLHWSVARDLLSIKPIDLPIPSNITKRTLLSLVSSVFDPLGLVSPITIAGKILVQAAWRAESSWDDPLPEEFINKWVELNKNFQDLASLSVPRAVAFKCHNYQLHVFCDSSTSAYGCAVYLDGPESTNLLMSKAKVAPLKTKTLPQLELTSVWLGFKVANYIHSTLGEIIMVNTYIWSDNEAAIQWIRNNNSNITYVKNRVSEIREMFNDYKLLYVPTNQNPADLVTRGVTFKELEHNSLWFHGPDWLPDKRNWPVQRAEIMVCEITAERVPNTQPVHSLFDITKYSSLGKVFRITEYIFKFLNQINSNYSFTDAPLFWLRFSQMSHYQEIFSWLYFSQCKEVSKFKYLSPMLVKPRTISNESSSLIRDLGLFFDIHLGVVRSRGRLQKSQLSEESKFPILLSPKDYLTNLIILKCHYLGWHCGVSETLASLRQQLWIPKGRQAVRSLLAKCVICKKVEGKPYNYPGPPPLPTCRVVHNRPFENVGVDYTGPIYLTKTDDGLPQKVYICLFTCTSTRAVHLDVALDMTAESFLLLLRRFCSTWSVPKQIISDNGTNFTAAAKFLEQASDEQIVREYCTAQSISWKFIAPRAPWQGGFYERMIKVVKLCLRKTLYRKRVNIDELKTVIVEIQARINNRPLTYITDSLESPEALTPSHLLYGRRIQPFPPLVMENTSDPLYIDHKQLNKIFSKLSQVIAKFEQVWKCEYLLSLRERYYGSASPSNLNNISVGDVVLVESESPRGDWPLGRIVSLRQDAEGIVRSAEVKCKNLTSIRTLEKLIPLEINAPLEVTPNVQLEESEPPPNSVSGRPVRASGVKAALHRQALINEGLI